MKNKGLLRRLVLLLAAACLLAACCMPALAKRAEYDYTIRIFSGQQGLIDGQDMVQLTVAAGDRLNLYTSSVTLPEDSKYYVKGFRESGKGTEEVLGVGSRLASFQVTKDQDYVVAYGLKGSMVEYTVNFQDGQGNTLAPSETYMGNVGDRPVVAYLYIEGYQPQSYNLTKTLVEDPMENVLTFVYSRVATQTTDGGTTIITGPGATVVTPTTPTTSTGSGTAGDEDGDDGDDDEDGGDEEESSAAEEESEPEPESIPEEGVPEAEPPTPAELVDIDEGEVPLANVNATPAPTSLDLRSEGKMFPWWGKLLVGMLALAAVCVMLWFLLFHRRKKEEARSMDITELTDINVIKDLMDDDEKL